MRSQTIDPQQFYDDLAEFRKKLEQFHAENDGHSFTHKSIFGNLETHHFSDNTASALDALSDVAFCITRFYNIEGN